MIKAGIIGATGYTGVELLRLIIGHPQVRLELLTSRAEQGKAVADLFPGFRGHTDLVFTDPDSSAVRDCDVVFFATPNGTAMHRVPPLLDSGIKVIDLSADFRLKQADLWEQWYGTRHACPELLQSAVYGLPELNREAIKTASLVANPGCYPTAVILALLPLLDNRLVDVTSLIADAKSGVSGAGRKSVTQSLYAEVAESFKAYAVSGHRHLPEICQALNDVAEGDISLAFVPHLAPMIRGIHATVYASLADADADLQEVYTKYYHSEAFVDVLPPGSHPDTANVRGTNFCRLAVHHAPAGKRVIILSVIDNLVKGAAGQAVQNMNIMFAFDEQAGLTSPALSP
ncbi:MAG: N-acetyl-gamma-glutamyl-phosphate reductase [Gammaproteobacteria bacterium]